MTEGKFRVTEVHLAAELTEEELIRIAASKESQSEHPIGLALKIEAEERGIEITSPDYFEAIEGEGISAKLDGDKYLAGTSKFIISRGLEIDQSLNEKADELSEAGQTLSFLKRENSLIGLIGFAYQLKSSSIITVRELQRMSMQVIMITGDNQKTAKAIAEQAGVFEYYAEVLPKDKADKVRELQDRGLKVAMVGDGINNAPALIQADNGIAIGAGPDVAIESADIVLVKNDPQDVSKLIRLSKATMQKMKENLAWATGYNAFTIPIAAGILRPWGITLRPQWGALIMTASSIIFVLNALRLRGLNLSSE